MDRKAAIAVVAVTAGVLIAGATASLAVINASSSVSTPDTVTLVADPAAVPAENVAAAPSLAASTLPEIVIPEVVSAAPSAPAPANTPQSKPSAKSSTTESVVASEISANEATKVVLAQASGKVMSVSKTTRGGYPAYAVKVLLGDGSTVTGYVSRADGVAFDWTQTAAPATTAPQTGDDDNGAHDDDGEGHEGGDD